MMTAQVLPVISAAPAGTPEPAESCEQPLVHPDQVERARRQAPRPVEIDRLTALFKLLGDPTRARILYAMLAVDEMCVCDLAATTGSTETTVSAALRLLRTAGAVVGRREGRMVFYRLADAHVRSLLDLSREHLGHQIGVAPGTGETGPRT